MIRKPSILSLAAALICVNLSAGPVGEVLRHDMTLTVRSATDARLDVTERILVNSENGSGLADFHYFTDAFSSISSFSGKIEIDGKVVKKIKQSDLSTVLYSDAFADDTYINAYSPSSSYPFVIEYSYSVALKKGMAVFPSFVPVSREEVPVREASYTIDLPSGMEMNYLSWADPEIADNGPKGKTYVWKVNDFEGLADETNLPDIYSLVPYVFASPKEFNYDGFKGVQGDWKSVGEWLHGILPKDPELPADLKAEVHRLTDSCPDDLAKLRAVYGWLRDHTRYVSIQFGIGGYSPMPPSRVYKTGYGDCKALSFLMHQMLAEAGVGSKYYIVNTRTRNFRPGYATVGQADHAMLCVPMQKDTVWVECTNPRLPLGFRHSSIAGHEVVLVDEDGGHLVRAGAYPDSLDISSDHVSVSLSPDGKAEVDILRTRYLDDAVAYDDFQKKEWKTINSRLTSALRCHADNLVLESVKDNFDSYNGTPMFIPRVDVSYRFETSTFAKVTGDRIFVPVSIFNTSLGYQKTSRRYEYVRRSGYGTGITMDIDIPEGYCIEYLPPAAEASCDAGSARLEVKEDGNTVRVQLSLSMVPCHIPADQYPAYRDFAKAFNKLSSLSIVLKKN